MVSKEEILEKLSSSVISYDEDSVKRWAKEALEAGIDPKEAIAEGLSKGIKVVGDKFHKLEMFLPEIMLAADAMKAGISILKEKMLEKEKGEMKKNIVIGTVMGDIHDIGKNLVSTILSLNGFEVHDLGTEVSPIKFVEEAKKLGEGTIIAMSSLMTTSRCYQADTTKRLEDTGLRDKFFVMVGGGVVNPEWARKIGADGYGRLMDDAVVVAKRFFEERPKLPLKEPIISE